MESRIGWLPAAIGLIFLFLSNPSHAQDATAATDRDSLFEKQILARLVKINPSAVPLFEEASRFYHARQYDKAKAGFEAVLQLAPDFPDAERRLGICELQLGDSAGALLHAERAYSTDPSPYNQSALALALVVFGDSSRYPEAFAYAESAANSLPDQVTAQMALLQSGMATFNEKAVQTASQRLVRLAPEYPLPHYFYGIALAQKESWEASERELLEAQSLGVPQEAIEEILAQGIRTHAAIERWKRRGIYTLVAWLATLALLFLLGAFLSKTTLGAVARTQNTGTFHVSRPEQTLRTLYRGVIAITSVYFYLSIPILLVIVLAAAGAFFYLLLQVGRIPIKLAVFVAIATLVTVYAILRSLFVRPRNTDPGRRIDREQAPVSGQLRRRWPQKCKPGQLKPSSLHPVRKLR